MNAVDFEAFVERLATVSGDAILPFFRTAIGAEHKPGKGAFDPVTEADRGGEAAMRALIGATFPHHGILGEEYGPQALDAEYVWVLDPIDGTKSFISGIPMWGTLIGLNRRGSPCYGMMHQPFIGERFTGDGKRARYRGPAGERALMTRHCADIGQATIMTTAPHLMGAADRALYAKVEARCRLARYGGDCYAYAMLAAGHVDLVIEAGLQPYDIVAMIPIIEGAGGIVTTWEGGPAANGGRVVVAGDPALHRIALEILNAG